MSLLDWFLLSVFTTCVVPFGAFLTAVLVVVGIRRAKLSHQQRVSKNGQG